MTDGLPVAVKIEEATDSVWIVAPNGELLVELAVDPKSGKYLVDDHATGRLFSDDLS